MSDGSRHSWLERRKRLEARLMGEKRRSTPDGQRGVPLLFGHDAKLAWGARAFGLYAAGARNAARPHLHRLDLVHADLPEAFDGFRILFLSDLHVDIPSGALGRAVDLVASAECDVAVFGGDFQSDGRPEAGAAAGAVAPLVKAMRVRDGIFGVLGNHDRHDVVAPLEALGISLLINETATLHRQGQHLTLIGCDDIHAFHDPAAARVLHQGEGFRVAIVHSPDFAPEAAAAGCSLYLAGHTHGGQVCLPGGRAIATALDRDRARVRGVWHKGGMAGYTSTGLGCGGMPVRFNCPPEVALITLRRGAP